MMIDEWNRTAAPYPREVTVHGLFEEVAAAWPDAPALECGGERTTYAELDARANRLARRLRGLGAGAPRTGSTSTTSGTGGPTT